MSEISKYSASDVDFKAFIESHVGFPKEGVVYFDFTPILAEPEVFRAAVSRFSEYFGGSSGRAKGISKIAAIEAKGFTLGAALAYEMKLPLVLIRKPELVPGEVDSEKFEKEYGFAEYQIKKGQFDSNDRVLLIYDIMAGPGASNAACRLIARSGATVVGCGYVIELAYLNGRENLDVADVFSLVRIVDDPR